MIVDAGCLGMPASVPEAENHKADETANSKVGSSTNTAVLYGIMTLGERLIP
jgi:hypothetical protein